MQAINRLFRRAGNFCQGLTVLAMLAVAGPASGALPAELDKPYQVEVVLHVAPNRLLTDVFKQQLVRELNDLLQQAAGGLAQVKVVTAHPLLKDVTERGLLAALQASRERPRPDKEAPPVKTHVVLVDFVAGQFYQIESAQHDGLTGLVTPVVRQARTADRLLVGKLAAELVWRDFGPVGTVVDSQDADRIKVALRGGRLPGAAELVQAGDVFAIAQVSRAGGQVVPEAYLQVVEAPQKDGIFFCRLLARYADDASKLKSLPGDFLGYRCLKLDATRQSLKLRLVSDKGQPHEGVRIEVARTGLNSARENKGLTNRDGMVDTKTDYDKLALVWVIHNGVARARIPVPLLDDRVTVLRAPLEAGSEDQVSLRIRRRSLNDLINGLLLVVNQVLRDINDLIREGKHPDALARAREGIRLIERGLPELRRELAGLRGEIVRMLPPEQRERLLDDSGLKQLEAALGNLQSFVATQEELIQEQGKQQKLQAEILNLINQARLARDQADYPEAIELYGQAIAKAGGKHAKLEQELAALRAAWRKVGGPEHQKAREFLFGVWAKVESAEQIKEHLDEVRKQVAICQKEGDLLGLNKFLVLYPQHAKRLEQLLVNQRRDTEEGFKRYETFDAVAEELVKLHKDVSEYVLSKVDKK
jgi:hypothetical protein